MEPSAMVVWLVAGVVLFFLEMGIPGIGLMFAGFGALTVGMLLDFSFIQADNTMLQALVFLVSTALWSLLLWKPIQKFGIGKKKSTYNNLIGETATVGENGISKTHGGEVLWSGTIMKAKLTEGTADSLAAGSMVVIKDISGNVLTVSPK